MHGQSSTDQNNGWDIVYHTITMFILLFLCFKLVRLNTIFELPWNLHLFLLTPILFVGVIFQAAITFKLEQFQSFRGSFVIISIASYLILFQLIIFNRGDQYFIAALSILAFFPLYYLAKLNSEKFLRSLELLMKLMIIISIFEVVAHFTGARFFDYFKDERFKPSTLATVHPLLGLRGRPTGFSGSVYATAALLGAFTVYFLYEKKYLFFSLGVISQVLYATPSVFIVIIAYIFLGRASLSRFIILIAVSLLLFPIFQYRLAETNPFITWLPTFETDYSPLELFVGAIFGFGVHSVKVDVGEIRIISLFLSWGLLLSVLFVVLYLRVRKFAVLIYNVEFDVTHRNLLRVPVVVLLANWHYETLMTFPNSLIIASIFALILAQYYDGNRSNAK